jgi:hypothetical protein
MYTRVTLQTMHGSVDSEADLGRNRVGRYCAGVTLRVAAGLPVGALLIGPGLIQGFRDGSPSIVRQNLDAFLSPICAALVAATLGGSIVASGGSLRDASEDERRASTWFAIALSVLIGAGLYGLLGWGLPLLLQRYAFPGGVTHEDAIRAHPFLLTTPELLRVQDTFRAVGGFSRRVSSTLDLRAWLAAGVPVFALLSAVAMLARRPRARLLKVLGIELGALVYFFAATILTAGPALFLRPHPGPSVIGWTLLLVVAFACAWQLRRALYPAAEDVTRLLG